MKKLLSLVALFLFFCISMAASSKLIPGEIKFKAQRSEDRYITSLQFRQAAFQKFVIKGIKVTCEPSGTILFALYDEKTHESDRIVFTAGKLPLSTIETSLYEEELAPSISLNFPSAIANDTQIKIEYLIENHGVVSTLLAAAITIDNIESISFSVQPANENSGQAEAGGGYRICCCDPPKCVNCLTPVGTCCCQCETHAANCGIIKCPPPPC